MMFTDAVDLRRDVIYTASVKLDLYVPLRPFKRGAVLLLHGGGPRASKGGTTGELANFLAGDGFVCADADYRNANDVKSALSWLRNQALELHFPGDALLIGGMSSGASLAVQFGYLQSPSWLCGVINLFSSAPRRPGGPACLVIAGGDDRTVSADKAKAWVAQCHAAERNASFISVWGYGHVVPLDTRVGGRMLFQRISDFAIAAVSR